MNNSKQMSVERKTFAASFQEMEARRKTFTNHWQQVGFKQGMVHFLHYGMQAKLISVAEGTALAEKLTGG